LQQQRTDGGEPSAPATPGLLLLSYTTPRDAAVRDAHEEFFLASAFQDHASTPDLSYNDNAEGGIDYCSPERSSQGLSYVDEDEEDTESEFEQIVYSATKDSSIDCDIEDGDNYWNNKGSLEDETANMQASHHEWLLNGG
jgi:hypothetical protein